MPLLFSPAYSPTRLLQLQSFFMLSSGAFHTLAAVGSLPLSKRTVGGGGWLVYLQFTWGCPSPIVLWSMPHFSCCYKPSHLHSKCTGGGGATPTFSGWLVYLQFHEGVLSPTLWSSGCPTLFAKCLFFQLLVYYSVWFFSLFFPGWGWSVQGAMLIWPRVVWGSTACRLAHLVVCFSQAG
jgi:hypothetical protein